MKIDSMGLLPLNYVDFKVSENKSTLKEGKIYLKKGKYRLLLHLAISEKNDADTLAIYQDEVIISLVKLTLQKSSVIHINVALYVKNDQTLLSFNNVSDDFLIIDYFGGGLIMSDQIKIFSFNNFNPFSFDLQLTVPFTEEIQIKVREAADPLVEIPVKLVDKLNLKDPSKSTENNPNLMTVIVADETNLFQKDIKYIVEVYNGSVLQDSEKYSFDFSTFTMMNDQSCVVKAFGTRLVVIEFDYPVRNLGAIVKHSTHNNQEELNNLYFSYYGKDFSIGELKNIWTGDIATYMDFNGNAIYPFYVEVSPDNRRLTIQSNLSNFNTGEPSTITINYTRDSLRDYTKVMTDYSGRIIASFEKEFLCVRNGVAETVESVTALSNHELQVVFTGPVCIDNKGIINPNYFGIDRRVNPNTLAPLNIKNISWVGNDYNTLLYNLKTDNISDLLPIPEVNLIIGTVLDVSGLDTTSEEFLVIVPLTEPKFINAYQVIPTIKQTNTQITLEYNEKMTIGENGVNSAENPANYTLVGPDGISILLPASSIKVIQNSDNTKFSLILPYVLPTGEYTITAYDTIADFTEVHIETTPKAILIMDYVSPLIEKIIVTNPDNQGTHMTENDNVMIIMFDKQMNVLPMEPASVLNDQNYVLEYGQDGDPDYTLYYLNDETKIENIYDKRWIRFTLPKGDMLDFNINKYHIHVGHVKGQSIYYVRSKSGNIYPLCEVENIDELVPKLSIVNGTAEVTDSNKIVYNLNSGTNDNDPQDGNYENNLFGEILASDFEVSKDGGATFDINPINVIFTGYPFNQVTFIFATNTFTSSDDIIIKVKDTGVTSKDIFGKTIELGKRCTVENNIPTALKGIGLLAVDHATRKAVIELLFEKSIAMYSITDFNVVYKDGGISHSLEELDPNLGLPVNSIDKVRANTIQLEVTLPTINDAILNNLYVSTSTSSVIPIGILDENGKTITPFIDEPVKIMKVDKFNWNYKPGTVAAPAESYEFILEYNDAINTRYVPAAINNVTPSYNFVAGSLVQIVTLDLQNQGIGKINMRYLTVDNLTTNILAWNCSVIVDPLLPKVMKIVVTPNVGNTLYDSAQAFTANTGRLKCEYVPYPTDTKTGAKVVDKSDKIKSFGIAPNAIIG